MKIVELVRLILKHLVLLITVPLFLALLVLLLTRQPRLTYASSTVLYTGLATGSSIEMDKAFNYFATNTAFDNLINITKSRQTQEEVAIRLLSLHLLLRQPDPAYISPRLFKELKAKIPAYLYNYVKQDSSTTDYFSGAAREDSLAENTSTGTENPGFFNSPAHHFAYEKTVEQLTSLMKSSDTNYIYKLLNYEDEHYSIKAISAIKAERIANSDLVKLSYETDDPGICRQTLAIFNEVCIKNYKHIKENRSDAVVKYFESQLHDANLKLKLAEDKLLEFNKSNKIINYYEQSKAVAVVKEDMEVDYNNKKAQLAGTEASVKRLEEKLNIQQQVQIKSNSLLEKRRQLGDVNYELAAADAEPDTSAAFRERVSELRKKSESIKSSIKSSINELYSYQNTTDGLPVATVLTEWINHVIAAEDLKAKLKVMDQRNKDFQQQYAIYAPAGANIKRIEREISVSEQGYLEILHGLNQAKLKLQDNELISDLKAVDPPYFPLQAVASKRVMLIIGAAILGFILMLGIILVMEYMDDTLKNSEKAARILQLPSAGIIPRILLNPGKMNAAFIQKRLVEITTQHIEQIFSLQGRAGSAKTILVVSTQDQEGKSVVAGNIALRLSQSGTKVMLVNCSGQVKPVKQKARLPLLYRLLGYPDPRIDTQSKFLADPSTYLPGSAYISFPLNEEGLKATSFSEFLRQGGVANAEQTDYLIIELPALLYNNYPAELVAKADLCLLVCRSNRLWSKADQSAVDGLLALCGKRISFIVNGAELNEVESVLGELPKERSRIRKKFKDFFRFQFFSKNKI